MLRDGCDVIGPQERRASARDLWWDGVDVLRRQRAVS